MKQITILLLTVSSCIFSSCENQAVAEKPERSKLVGTWECKSLSQSVRDKVGSPEDGILPRLTLNEDGSFEAANFPVRDPYEYINLSSKWELVQPALTPTNSWSVVADVYHLQCRKDESLRLTVSAKNHLFVYFRRIR